MDHNAEIIEPYTNQDFAKDMAVAAAQTAASVAGAYAILLVGSYVASKLIERRKAKNSRIIEN